MPKKRRINNLKPRRRRSKSPPSGEDVVSARDRLKGALQDLLPRSEEESDTSDDQNERHWSSLQKSGKKGGAVKKENNVTGERKEPCGFRQAFKMKLFDRTVDMSNYTDSTPLYPICRAWIANQSLNYLSHSSYGNDEDDVKESKRINNEDSIYALPPPEYKLVSGNKIRVPKPFIRKTEYPNKTYNDADAPSQDELLKDNLLHWAKVRKSWMQASKDNENRYKDSIELLTDMFYNSQK